jgi:Na+/H+ antiporter NhaA
MFTLIHIIGIALLCIGIGFLLGLAVAVMAYECQPADKLQAPLDSEIDWDND